MIVIPRPLRLTFYSLLIIAGAVLAAALATRHAERQALVDDAARANQQLALYANSLHTLIERYRALPAVLALDSEMISALKAPLDTATQAVLNRKLERINGAAQSSTLELMDRTGLTVAASNWNLPSSYVGHNYAFRPYFSQTLSQGTGRFYAVGVTTGIPGYFLSSAVVDEHEQFLGAMVVKLEFPELEREWAQGNCARHSSARLNNCTAKPDRLSHCSTAVRMLASSSTTITAFIIGQASPAQSARSG
jgi:two-component system C4-dicarboxylate transport sensor histidine kinase DctB